VIGSTLMDVWVFLTTGATDAPAGWQPSVGDPTVAGWVIFGCYFAAVYLCVRAAKATANRVGSDSHTGRPRFWLVLAVGLVLLGINKQLDFQTLLVDLARDLAREQEWYARRREIAAIFVQAVAAVGILALLVCGWIIRRSLRHQGPALVGMVFLVTFIVVRAASFHAIDKVLCAPVGAWRLHWLLEIAGIACVGGAAILRIMWRPPP